MVVEAEATHLGFLQVIGQTSIPDGLEGLQKKSAYCAQFIPSVQLARGVVVIEVTGFVTDCCVVVTTGSGKPPPLHVLQVRGQKRRLLAGSSQNVGSFVRLSLQEDVS